MINALIAWMYDVILADGDLDALLARSVLVPDAAAVYSTAPIPPGAEMPYVVLSGPVVDEPDDTFDAEYRTPSIDIHVYDSRPDAGGGTVTRVNTAAELLRALFHRRAHQADIAGTRVLVLQCSGPIVNDGDHAFGRVVTARCLLTAA
jgi:hypothetical protein